MERIVYLDTHAVVWLYAGRLDLFPSGIRRVLEEDSLAISPIILLELQYLLEVGKIKARPEIILGCLHQTIGLNLAQQDFIKVVTASIMEDWTRDPFDRIIVAQAQLTQSLLITKDGTIHKHYKKAIWTIKDGDTK